eukprot:c10029_g1_i2.p1 GENE.c10029_g1_i2~~c10029_g1_i2.p1  ORF type:complete len:592 (+),score=274.97 c10029_g1_i2:41-1816(+)
MMNLSNKLIISLIFIIYFCSCLHIEQKSTIPLSSTESDGELVVVVPSKSNCNLNEEITVAYQRVPNQRDPVEKTDYIGLFRKFDPTVLVPYAVNPINTVSQTGQIPFKCTRAGDMEIRVVRVGGKIIGKASLKVYGECVSPNCNGHGTCSQGACKCSSGWEGEGCDLISGEGVILGWLDNPTGEFYVGQQITAKLSAKNADPKSNGYDTIGIFKQSSNSPIQSSFVPESSSQVDLPVPSEPGSYYLKFTRGIDSAVIATSQKFNVYRPCPIKCSYHGKCSKGNCVCDSGFDRPDCSRGPGVVNVTFSGEAYAGTTLTASFSRDETSPIFSDSDWIGVYKAKDDSTDNPEYYSFAISTKIYDPDVKAKKANNNTQGTVQILMPFVAGNYVLKYVRQDHAKYFTTPEFTVYNTCPYNCSNNGKCTKGVCVCNRNWKGSQCDEGIADFTVTLLEKGDLTVGDTIHVNFTRPAGNNTDYDYIGVYGQESQNNTDQLYSYGYAIATQSDDRSYYVYNGTVQIQLASEGKMVLRYVNAYTYATEVQSAMFTVYPQCPNNCSENGTCLKGVCKCNAKWKGNDCSESEDAKTEKSSNSA